MAYRSAVYFPGAWLPDYDQKRSDDPRRAGLWPGCPRVYRGERILPERRPREQEDQPHQSGRQRLHNRPRFRHDPGAYEERWPRGTESYGRWTGDFGVDVLQYAPFWVLPTYRFLERDKNGA